MKINTEKLRAALSNPKTAVHCDTEEKAEALGEAINITAEALNFAAYGKELCVANVRGGASIGKRCYFTERGYTILPLDDFILPDKPRLAEVLGVEVGQEFEWRGERYRINSEGAREFIVQKVWHPCTSESRLTEMINNPHEINIIPKWSADDIADARAARRLIPDYKWVARDKAGSVYVYRREPERYKGSEFFEDGNAYGLRIFPDALPGVTWENSPVRIEDIR